MNLIWTAPCPAESAPCAAVATVTSSIASRRGLISEKNPQPPPVPVAERLLLSCVLTPSIEMLIAPRAGR